MPSSFIITIFSKVYHTQYTIGLLEFLTNLEGHKSNCRLVTRFLARKNAKRPITDNPQAYIICIHSASVRAKEANENNASKVLKNPKYNPGAFVGF